MNYKRGFRTSLFLYFCVFLTNVSKLTQSRLHNIELGMRLCIEILFHIMISKIKYYVGGLMHNIISRNQLAEWNHFEGTITRLNEDLDLVNDYFDCLIECEEDQGTCKRICRILLKDEG